MSESCVNRILHQAIWHSNGIEWHAIISSGNRRAIAKGDLGSAIVVTLAEAEKVSHDLGQRSYEGANRCLGPTKGNLGPSCNRISSLAPSEESTISSGQGFRQIANGGFSRLTACRSERASFSRAGGCKSDILVGAGDRITTIRPGAAASEELRDSNLRVGF